MVDDVMSFSCADSANFDAAAIQQLPNPLYYDPMFMHQLPIESAFHSIHPNDGMEDYVSAGHCQMELTSVAPARRANCASPDSAFASSSDVDSLWDSSSMMTTAADFEDDDDEVDLDVDSDDVLLDVEDGSVNWLDDFLSNRIESNGCSDKTELQATANDWTEEDISSSVVDESHAINTSNQSVCMVDVVAEDDGSRTPTKTAPQSSPTVRNLLKSVLRQKLQNRGEDVDTLSKVTPKKQVCNSLRLRLLMVSQTALVATMLLLKKLQGSSHFLFRSSYLVGTCLRNRRTSFYCLRRSNL